MPLGIEKPCILRLCPQNAQSGGWRRHKSVAKQRPRSQRKILRLTPNFDWRRKAG